MSPTPPPGGDASPALECRDVVLAYGESPVVRDLSLTVAPGETVALLGPSGSGKSSLLYAIAGFLRPRSGSIGMGGRVASSEREWLAPERRSIGMVFQSYALWPHMTALETVAYPLRRSGVSPSESRRRAQELLERVGIGVLAGRRPAELSGGEQQRVGLCRALARDPALYLFDEPTAHLDSALRADLQEQLASQRHGSKAAGLYATHDVAEALAVADRVALLHAGRIVQIGTPVEIYERPVDLWAAQLTGAASLLRVDVEGLDGTAATVSMDGQSVVVQAAGPDVTREPASPPSGPAIGARAAIVRPGWLRFGGPLPGRVRQTWYRGPHTDYRLYTPAGELTISEAGPPRFTPGESIAWRLDRVWFLPAAGAGAESLLDE